jgi:hypothetical protein
VSFQLGEESVLDGLLEYLGPFAPVAAAAGVLTLLGITRLIAEVRFKWLCPEWASIATIILFGVAVMFTVGGFAVIGSTSADPGPHLACPTTVSPSARFNPNC